MYFYWIHNFHPVLYDIIIIIIKMYLKKEHAATMPALLDSSNDIAQST